MNRKVGGNTKRSQVLKALMVFLFLVISTPLVAASNSSVITLTGEVAAYHTLDATPLAGNTGIILTNTNTNLPVARLDITSNQINGFKLNFSTTNGFKMKYNSSELSYSLRLQRVSGALAGGLLEPSIMTINSAGSLIFGGAATSVTNVSYNLLYNSTPTGGLATTTGTSTYTDTITITISDI